MAINGLNVRCLCQTRPKPKTGRILGYVAPNRIPRAPIPPASPHFLWFPPLRIAQRDPHTPVPMVTSCSRRAAQPAHSWGQRWVHRGPRGEKKIVFEVVPRALGMLKQVFLARFEPVVARYGPWKIPKSLENGPFWNQKWVKNGSKTCFSKSDRGRYGMLKQVFLAHFEPTLTQFSGFRHMYAPSCALRRYLRAVRWSHLELGRGV